MNADKTYSPTTKQTTLVATRGLLLSLVFMFVGCGVSQEDNQEATAEDFSLTGTWDLCELHFMSGQRVDVRTGYEYVWYRFFEDNGTYYVAEVNIDDSRKPVKPHDMSEYFFMMSPYDTVYIEHGRMTELEIIDSHTIGIDRGDYVEVYVKSDEMAAERVSEIERTVEEALRPNHGRKTQYIVPATATTDDRNVWTWLLALLGAVCPVALYTYYRLRVKERFFQPTAEKCDTDVKEAPTREEQAEQAFVHTDYYLALRQRLYEGPALKQDEWEELEAQMKSACPGFFRRLAEMGQLSEVEQRVCVLTKLGIPPSAIAVHTYREYSSISSIRSRLYFKLFGKKGGARELDEYIRNL